MDLLNCINLKQELAGVHTWRQVSQKWKRTSARAIKNKTAVSYEERHKKFIWKLSLLRGGPQKGDSIGYKHFVGEVAKNGPDFPVQLNTSSYAFNRPRAQRPKQTPVFEIKLSQ